MNSRLKIVERVSFAQDFFRFAYLVGNPISFGLKVGLPDSTEVIVFDRHSLTKQDLGAPKKKLEICGTLLERLAYRLLAMELNSALDENSAIGRRGERVRALHGGRDRPRR